MYYVHGNGVHQKICSDDIYFSNMFEIDQTTVLKPIVTPKKSDVTLMNLLEKKINPMMKYINVVENAIDDKTIQFKNNDDFEWNYEENALVPDYFYQSFVIAKELAPKSKLGYSETNLITNENKFFFVKQVIEHMITFIEPILPDFIGFIIEEDNIDIETLKTRMNNLKTLHIKSHVIYKGPGKMLNILKETCENHISCETFEYQTYNEYSGKEDIAIIFVQGDDKDKVKLTCGNDKYDIRIQKITKINMYQLPNKCKEASTYKFKLEKDKCSKDFIVKLDDITLENNVVIEKTPEVNIDIYIKDASFCVYVDENHYKYVADVHVDYDEPNLKWAFSDEKSTCVSNFICTSKPCLANRDDTLSITSKDIHIDKTKAVKETFTVDIYTYDETLGVKYIYSKSIVNDVIINCKDTSFKEDIVEVKPDATLTSWLSSGEKAPKILQKSDIITLSISMKNKYKDININIDKISWSLNYGNKVLEDNYIIKDHCKKCDKCILNNKNIGKHSDVVSNIILQNFLDELYKYDNHFEPSNLKLNFNVEASLSFCNTNRRNLLSTFHMNHKHIKKSTSFGIDLGHKKQLTDTIHHNLYNQDRITLTISGGSNILITVLFVLFVAFACLCYSIHLYMPTYERRRREEEEFNFKTLE